MRKKEPYTKPEPMSERTFWAWLMAISGVVCWLIAAGWAYRAHLVYDTEQTIFSGYSLGFFILGLGPLGVALAMWMRPLVTERLRRG